MPYPRTHTVRFIAFATLMAVGSLARADVSWLARAAFETGGDELEGVRFTNGDTATIDAGGGIDLELGARVGVGESGLETDLTIGYKFDSITAENADLAFARVTLDAVQYIRFAERIRVGAGLTYELAPTLEVEGPNGVGGSVDLEVEADDAFGYLIAADYLVGRSVEVGLRATFIEYDFEGGATRDGDSVGGYATIRF